MTITFVVPGPPQGKARARTVRTKTGASHSYTPEKTANYENWIRVCYQQAGGELMEKCPVRLKIIAKFSIAQSTSKKDKVKMLSGELRPTKKPDADNIAKVICDALNQMAWGDDSCVVSLIVVKVYDDAPGLIVTITAQEALDAKSL